MFRVLRQMLIASALATTVAMFGFSVSVVRAADVEFSNINAAPDATTAPDGIIFAGICDAGVETCPCRDEGTCTLDDALQVFANIAVFILGISGSAVLFVFVYGGYKWLFSRGDSKWVESGKEAMTAGVIGLMIIFGSYVALNFIIAGLTTPSGTPDSTVLEETVTNGLEEADKPDTVFTTETE